MKDIVIYGAGGLGKEIAWLIENINSSLPTWNILGLIEDNSDLFGREIYGLEVLGSEMWLSDYGKEIYLVCAIGRGSIRKSIYERVTNYPNIKLATLVDPSVRIDKSVKIGQGTIICRNCIVTIDTIIGEGVLMNTGASVGHDSKVGNYCTFLTNSIASGNTTFGECCDIGSGAFILQGKSIVSNTILAPLSLVLKDITEAGTYSGNPARRMI